MILQGLTLLKQARQIYETTGYDPKTGQHKEESSITGKINCFAFRIH